MVRVIEERAEYRRRLQLMRTLGANAMYAASLQSRDRKPYLEESIVDVSTKDLDAMLEIAAHPPSPKEDIAAGMYGFPYEALTGWLRQERLRRALIDYDAGKASEIVQAALWDAWTALFDNADLQSPRGDPPRYRMSGFSDQGHGVELSLPVIRNTDFYSVD